MMKVEKAYKQDNNDSQNKHLHKLWEMQIEYLIEWFLKNGTKEQLHSLINFNGQYTSYVEMFDACKLYTNQTFMDCFMQIGPIQQAKQLYLLFNVANILHATKTKHETFIKNKYNELLTQENECDNPNFWFP